MARFKYIDINSPLVKRRVEEALRTGSGGEMRGPTMTSPSPAKDAGSLIKPVVKGAPDSACPISSGETGRVAIGSSRRCDRPVPSSYSRAVVRAFFREYQLPEPCFEYHFHPTRKYRFDIAWPEKRVAIEVQGGIWMQGRHVQPSALIREYEKLNSAAIHGWRLLYILPDDLCRASTVVLLKLMLL